MRHSLSRRDFLAASAVTGVGLWAAGQAQAASKAKISKSMIGKPDEATLKKLKEAGFDGIESDDKGATPEKAAAAREVADKLGMKIHSVLWGWARFNSDKPAEVEADLASVSNTLRAAKAYGASAVLLVPCRIGGKGMAMPEAWDFDIEFDEKTGHVQKVVKGDNAKYAAYIEAHNHAIDTSRKAVEKLIPVAEETGVLIALENVWNNLWVKPAIFAHFIKSFNHPKVQCYFDIGNHVKYALPEEWIRALGKTIVKLHVKDFKLKPDGHGGDFVHPRDGSVNWPLVRQEIAKIGYSDFMTIEDGGLSLREFSERLDLIIAGK